MDQSDDKPETNPLDGEETENQNENNHNESEIFPRELILEKVEKVNLENHHLKQENQDLINRLKDLEKSCQNFKIRSEKYGKQIENVKSELQSMVIKYATSEKEVLDLKKRCEDLDRKNKELSKERDYLQNKTKELGNEKKQLLQNVERNILESATLRNKNEILKNKLEQTDVQIQKLQLTINDVSSRYEFSKSKLDEIENAMKKLKLDNGKSGQIKSNDPELEEPITDEKNCDSSLENKSQSAEENWVDLYLQCVHSNQNLTEKIQDLEKEIQDYQKTIEDLNSQLIKAKEQVKNYLSNLDLIESLKKELLNRQDVINDIKQKFDQINEINRDLLNDANSSKNKESELLEYTERLTAKLVSLQSEHNILSEKLKNTEADFERYRSEYSVVTMERDNLESQLKSFKEAKESEIEDLKKQVEQKDFEQENLKRKIEELENDINIMKRKHILNLKELNKEIQTLRKNQQQQLKQDSNKLGHQVQPSTTETNSSLSSRTNSITSLNEIESSTNVPQYRRDLSNHNNIYVHDANEASSYSDQSTTTSNNNIFESIPPSVSANSSELTSLNDIDKNTLIERILRLQRQMIKRNEKIDFLEEHNGQLVEEVKKKSKLLQYYILKEETGALATEVMDKNKAYLSKRGGIMSSLYNSSLTDDTMTLERSLEINNKLHAILEDTLLKNMTLKENLNTLAMEIDRLTKELNCQQSQKS